MNIAGMNGGNGVMAGVPMMNNGMNGATPRQNTEEDENAYESRLNAYIYDHFIRSQHWESARALMNSNVPFEPPLKREGEVNGTDDAMQTDAKDELDSKKPHDLPPSPVQQSGQGASFLLEWFALFWEVYFAQTKPSRANPQAQQYVNHTQAQSRLRTEQQQALLQGGIRQMLPGSMNDQQMMRIQQAYGMQMGGDLRKNAMNNRGAFNQPTPQQMAQMKQQHLLQQQMRREPSDMDMNGQRPHTPSSGDNAPSPSKRQRLDGAQFNGQMMANGRGPLHNMQGQPMMDMNGHNQANQILMRNGINPEQLSQSQFQSFQAQNPQIQEKSIQVYAQNLAKTRGQGMPRPGMGGQDSPMMQPGFEMNVPPVDMYSQQMMRGVPGPNAGNGGNHALQDYQMQLMLLEQQNKKRLLMARQEQDSVGRDGQPMPGGPGGFAPGMSPSGSRSGPSPEPGQMKRGTPKMGPTGLPNSPMPDGNMPQRSSPAAMGFASQMPPEMYQNGMPVPPNGIRMAPSSHPGQFGGVPFAPTQAAQAAQMEAMRARGVVPNGANWQQGPQGQAPMMQQPAQTQQPQPMGTPQQRTAMPPPPTVQPGAATNGRPSPPAQAAPPTPQQSNKAKPKGKKDSNDTRKRPTKKGSTASVAATPSGEPEAPPTPTPATPTIPQHPNSFNAGQKADPISQPAVAQPAPTAAPAPSLAPQQPDINVMPQFDINDTNGQYRMDFGPLENGDVLDNFDFDSFLQNNDDFNDFDTTGFPLGNPEGVETGTEGV